EALSEHPIGRAIVLAAANQRLSKATKFESTAGTGVQAEVGKHLVYIGKPMRDAGQQNVAVQIADRWQSEGKTTVSVRVDNKQAGLIAIADALKPNSAAAVNRLRELG